MKIDGSNAWSVRIDVKGLWGGTREYTKHVNLIVLADTVERAIATARQHYPESKVWAVNHQSKDAIVLLDDDAAGRAALATADAEEKS